MADTLATLARLRRLQANAAKRGLADALRAEAEAEAALHQARQAPGEEAGQVAEDQPLLAAAFASWLPRAAAAVSSRAARVDEAAQQRGTAMAGLQAAEGALEAVRTVQDECTAVARRASLRRTQLQLDEAGTQRKARQAVLF